MSVITPFNGAKQSSPEQYAPPHRRSPKNPADVDQAVSAFEDEMRGALRSLSRQPGNPDSIEDPAVDASRLIQRLAGASMEEVDRVILELQNLRDMLRIEGERMNHEIARFARLNQASMIAMRSIADSLVQRKGAPETVETSNNRAS